MVFGGLMSKIQGHANAIGARAAVLASDAKKAGQQAAFMAKDKIRKMTAGKKHHKAGKKGGRKTHKKAHKGRRHSRRH